MPATNTLRDRVVIALIVVIHPAHALVEARDDPGDVRIDIHIGPVADQPERRGEMRFMRPVGARQGARRRALPIRRIAASSARVGREGRSSIGLSLAPIDDRAFQAFSAVFGAAWRTPSSTSSANCAKLSTNRSTSLAAVASYSALFGQVSRGSRMAVSTPGTATGTRTRNSGQVRNWTLFRLPSSAALSSARVALIGMRRPMPVRLAAGPAGIDQPAIHPALGDPLLEQNAIDR